MRQEELIGTTKAAQLLGTSPRTIHRRVKDGVLTPAMTAPGGYHGAYLFRLADVEQLLEERKAS